MFKELVKPEVAICLWQVKNPQDHETTPTAPQASTCRLAEEAEKEDGFKPKAGSKIVDMFKPRG